MTHTGDDQIENKKENKTREERIRFYLSAASLTLLFTSFTVFVFLIPFIIDPAVASLRGDLVQEAVWCRVLVGRYRLGVSRCQWSSCREGCTQDIHECHQVEVEYSPLEAPDLTLPARLLVNIRGCGYPPGVNCSTWFNSFGINDSLIPCYYSRSNISLALTHVDIERDKLDLAMSIIIPGLVFFLSLIIVCLLHAKCCSKSHQKRSGQGGEGLPKKRRKLQENLEEYGRTSSRDKLIAESRTTWRRNSVKTSRN